MWMTVRQCLDQVAQFDDTHELAGRLRDIADAAEPGDAYFMREAATNMEGMAALLRSMAGRLQQGPQQPHDAPAPAVKSRLDNGKVPPFGPIPAETDAGQLLDLPRVLHMAGVGRTSWLANVESGAAPKPVRIGRRTFWLQADVEQWISNFIQGRPPTPKK